MGERTSARAVVRKSSGSAGWAAAAAVVLALGAARCGGSSKPPPTNVGLPPQTLDASVPPIDTGPDAGPSDPGPPSDGGPGAADGGATPGDAGGADDGGPVGANDGGPGGATDAGADDGGPVVTNDGGPVGSTDGGTGGTDGGPTDGGTTDGGLAGPPTPTLVDPVRADVQFVSASNLTGVSADEGGFVWAVSHDTLYLLRPGATSFEAYNAGNSPVGNSSRNNGLWSVAGAAPGEVWVGYLGVFQNGESDDPSIPLDIRQSGGADHFVATPTGIRLEQHVMFWTGPGILALEPAGRWKVRSIYRIVYNHGPVGIPGDVFFGGTHGTAVVHANGGMEEHQHAGWNYCSTPSPDSCSLLAGDHHGLALHPPTGNAWIGADFAAIYIGYMRTEPTMPHHHAGEWTSWWGRDPDAPWQQGFRAWRGRSADTDHREWGGRDMIKTMAFDAYGDLWIGSWWNGLARARIDPATGLTLARKQGDLDVWNHRDGKLPPWPGDPANGTVRDWVYTIEGDPDGSLWVGGPHGAWRFVAATDQWVRYGGVLPGQNVWQISLDPRPGVRAVYFATNGGLAIYRGK